MPGADDAPTANARAGPPAAVALRGLGAAAQALLAQLGPALQQGGLRPAAAADPAAALGVLLFDELDAASQAALRAAARQHMLLAVYVGRQRLAPAAAWEVLDAGAVDLLQWPGGVAQAEEMLCRLQRWHTVQQLLDGPAVRARVAGVSPAWRALLRSVAEVAHFTAAPVLVQGETGTGKEQVAQLVHQLDSRPARGEFVVLDCTTLSPELAGSEFFGHERGAFTGAAMPRDGAFALAHRGTLFLDEVGELPLPLQAQLLRVVQERQYKRLGSNTWQHSDFRLVCATHRDLEAAVAAGTFRADLYYRIAGWRCSTPPLRERPEDILPLARFFLAQMDPRAAAVELDPAVHDYLLGRAYPGNARELRQVVQRLWQRHGGRGPLTVGAVPPHERPGLAARGAGWPDALFEGAIRHAVQRGIGLKEIGQVAADLATQAALEQEGGSVQRAAARLGVTDRALQIRQAQRRAVP